MRRGWGALRPKLLSRFPAFPPTTAPCCSPQEWPGLKKLPNWGKVNLGSKPSRLVEKYHSLSGVAALSAAGLDLLQGMLRYDPEQRISAEAALQHR